MNSSASWAKIESGRTAEF